MSSPWKIYRVRFCVHDYYIGEIKARDELDAIARAQDLYCREHEDAFEFDISRGGPDEWDAEVVA